MAEGAVLTLRALEKPVEAEALAAEWSDRSTEVQALFLGLGAARLTMDPPPDLDALYVERYAKATDATVSGDGAQAMGCTPTTRASRPRRAPGSRKRWNGTRAIPPRSGSCSRYSGWASASSWPS